MQQFAEFFAKAVLEFTRRLQEGEVKVHEPWSKPIFSIHDGQSLPIAFFKRLLYAGNPIMRRIPVFGSTHTYLNRTVTLTFETLRDARNTLNAWVYCRSIIGISCDASLKAEKSNGSLI